VLDRYTSVLSLATPDLPHPMKTCGEQRLRWAAWRIPFTERKNSRVAHPFALKGADELKEETKRQEPDSPASVASSNSSTYMDL